MLLFFSSQKYFKNDKKNTQNEHKIYFIDYSVEDEKKPIFLLFFGQLEWYHG